MGNITFLSSTLSSFCNSTDTCFLLDGILVLKRRSRQAGERLNSRRKIHRVSKHVVVLVHYVPEMHSHADPDSAIFRPRRFAVIVV